MCVLLTVLLDVTPSRLKCLALDLIPPSDDLPMPAVVYVSRCGIDQSLVITFVVAIFDEPCDIALEFPWKVILLQIDHVLRRPMMPLDLALGHRMQDAAESLMASWTTYLGFCIPEFRLNPLITPRPL